MNCAKCGLPILYGVASYGGPHCMCHTKPNYDHNAPADLLKERDQLKAENETLKEQVKVLQSDKNSWQSGYDEGRRMGGKHCHRTIDTLRKQLDEARELLEECSDMADACEDQVLLGHIEAWLEANK